MATIITRLVFAFLFMGALTSCATAQDVDTPRRIIAVGDLHGDHNAYKAIIEAAGLIDKRGRWAGGTTIFVQTGDIPDRGPDSKKIVEHLRKLQKDAAKKGGSVVTLVGNHEAMNMTHDLRYVHPGEYEAFKDRKSTARRAAVYEANREAIEAFRLAQDATLSSEAIRDAWYADWPLGRVEHQTAWSAKGEIGAWVAQNRAVAKIGDTLFVHGGLSAEYSIFSLDEINARVGNALAIQDPSPDSILVDPLGPLWYRGLVQRDEQVVDEAAEPSSETQSPAPAARPSMEEEIALVLAAYDARRVVVGHTPNLDGVRATLHGRVIQIDTGAAAYYGGVRAYLEIVGDVLTAHNIDTGENRILATGMDVK